MALVSASLPSQDACRGGPSNIRFRQLKAGDHRGMIGLGIEDLGSKDYGFIMQELVVHLGALEEGEHRP